jgi:type IX secretion system PorP/SprF family membrane protein
MKKIFYILIFLTLCLSNANAQDPQFSQFYSVPAYLGPSFAGTSNGARIIMNYRNQWPGVPNTFETYSLSMDMNLPQLNSGIGAIVIRDKLSSALYKTNVGAQYAYNFSLKTPRIKIRPGITFYYVNLRYDESQIVLGHQIMGRDETLAATNMPRVRPVDRFDGNVSVLAFTEYVWLGGAVDHLTRANESLTNTESVTPIKYLIFGGYKYDFNRNQLMKWPERSISFTFLYKKQGDYNQLDIGCYWAKHPLTLGMWYRGLPIVKNVANQVNQDAIVMLAGVRLSQFKLAYSYDISISSMFLQSRGTHEFTLTWEIPYSGPKKRIAPIPCPSL